MVKVIYNIGADLFEIHLDDGSIEEDVYADQLVDIIDSMVERCDNYSQSVKKTYNIV